MLRLGKPRHRRASPRAKLRGGQGSQESVMPTPVCNPLTMLPLLLGVRQLCWVHGRLGACPGQPMATGAPLRPQPCLGRTPWTSLCGPVRLLMGPMLWALVHWSMIGDDPVTASSHWMPTCWQPRSCQSRSLCTRPSGCWTGIVLLRQAWDLYLSATSAPFSCPRAPASSPPLDLLAPKKPALVVGQPGPICCPLVSSPSSIRLACPRVC